MRKFKFGQIVIITVILLILAGDLLLIDYNDLSWSNNIVPILGVPTNILLLFLVLRHFKNEKQ
jgi:hypothetical protein